MCTVSVIQCKYKIIVTSNRDEKTSRPAAIKPKVHALNKKKVIFPKDPRSGGSWFTVDDQANIAVLLNGAEEKHDFKGGYRKSRGLILLDIIGSNSPLKFWEHIDLKNIEPFTIVLVDKTGLHELQWNGTNKKHSRLENDKHYIWSSATLYSKTTKEKREQWFKDFTKDTKNISPKEILDFHQETQIGDQENGLQINRQNLTKTLSITQCVVQKNMIKINYLDLNERQSHNHTCFII